MSHNQSWLNKANRSSLCCLTCLKMHTNTRMWPLSKVPMLVQGNETQLLIYTPYENIMGEMDSDM